MRLFCFPFAGGGSAVFHQWPDKLSQYIEVIAIEPPGRFKRIHEKPINNINEFVNKLFQELPDYFDKPFAIFGHCLGGLTAFEACRRITNEYSFTPLRLIISGSRSPDRVNMPGAFEQNLMKIMTNSQNFNPFLASWEQNDDIFSNLIRQFGINQSEDFLADSQLRELMLPVIRAEFEMTANYQLIGNPLFNFPITCFSGNNDPYVSRADSLAWGKFTQADFKLHARDGAHFMLVDNKSTILQLLNQDIEKDFKSTHNQSYAVS